MPASSGRIQILPQGVIEKIAAGEVVERPTSVVKELVENSLDARADKIDVTIDDGGMSFMAVSDNGCGVDADDLPRALVRYATSKIRTADDLFAVATMGFRGEALASIGAVSRLRLVSSSGDDGLGYAIASEGGVVGEAQPVGRTRGTTIEVRDLFFNVPARKKFMKSARAESMALSRLMEQLVVAFPAVHFTLTIDGKRVLDTPATDSPVMRIAQIAGHEFAKGLIRCTDARTDMDLELFISPPDHASARARFQNLYVNLRRIDNDTVTAAVRQGFARFINEQFRPSYFCFLSIDPSKVDVNVHPTKKVIKFDDERSVFSFVYGAIQRTISGAIASRSPVELDPRVPHEPPDPVSYAVRETTPPVPVSEAAAEARQQVLPFPGITLTDHKHLEGASPQTVQLSESVEGELWSLISCYQVHATYILAPIKNGILLIDQHAAHERVLYEQALDDLKRGGAASQQLLFPIVVELTPTEKAVIEGSREYLQALGFEVGDFGGGSISISAIPAQVRDAGVDAAIRSMVEFLLDEGNVRRHTKVESRYAAAYACGAAIKAGQKLDQEEMNVLLNNLFATENPYTCPHGRPTVVRISLEELARRFLR